jgi:hypothetical protein
VKNGDCVLSQRPSRYPKKANRQRRQQEMVAEETEATILDAAVEKGLQPLRQ